MGESMLSVVSPAFNEARNLPAVYEKTVIFRLAT